MRPWRNTEKTKRMYFNLQLLIIIYILYFFKFIQILIIFIKNYF